MGAAVTRAAVAAVAVRPSLWFTALRVGVRMVPRGWWHRPPFLPRPDPAYVGFRAVTQYGDADHPSRRRRRRAVPHVVPVAEESDMRRRRTRDRGRASKRGPAPVRVDR